MVKIQRTNWSYLHNLCSGINPRDSEIINYTIPLFPKVKKKCTSTLGTQAKHTVNEIFTIKKKGLERS